MKLFAKIELSENIDIIVVVCYTYASMQWYFILKYRKWSNMSNDNIAGKRIETANGDGKSKLDSSVKMVLAIKSILARILKGCVKEYSDLDVQDIETKYIEGNILVSKELVHQDEVMPVITGTNTEHKSKKEGTVTFDLKFNAFVPGEDGPVQFIVNVEGQNTAAYPLIKRGIYYCGRMLSAQYGTVFVKKHYEMLRKVISIWVCFEGDKEERNTITRYSLQPTCLYGDHVEKIGNYNMIDVIMLYIGNDKETDNQVLKMLDKLFSDDYNVSEKKRFLQEECGINLSESDSKEVDGMCNYSDYVYARGEKAMLLQNIRSIMDSLKCSSQKAMDVLKVPKELQAELLPLI